MQEKVAVFRLFLDKPATYYNRIRNHLFWFLLQNYFMSATPNVQDYLKITAVFPPFFKDNITATSEPRCITAVSAHKVSFIFEERYRLCTLFSILSSENNGSNSFKTNCSTFTMNTPNVRRLLLAVFLFSPAFLMAQVSLDCKDLHSGRFYFYSHKDYSTTVFTREDYIQKEFSPNWGDTALWRITWLSDCRYELAYVSGNRVFDALAKESMNDFITEVQITGSTPEYYLFQSTNKATKAVLLTDTIWRKEHPEKMDKRDVVAASFPGGLRAWKDYLTEVFTPYEKRLLNKGVEGTCLVRFVVDVDGRISEVTPLTLKGTLIAKIAVRAIEDSPRWIPETVDGSPQKTLKLLPITYQF